MGISGARRALARIVAVSLVAVVALLAGPGGGAALACSCLPQRPAEALEHAAAVVVGTVTRMSEHGTTRTYTMAVQHSYKQRVTATIDIDTPSQSPACGADLDLHGRQSVMLNQRDGRWRTNLCTQTVNRDAVIALAGPPIEPQQVNAVPDVITHDADADQSSLTKPIVAVAGILAGVVLLGFLILIAARRR